MNRAEMRARYESAPTIGEFIAGARQNQELWGSLVARATVSPDLVARAAAVGEPRHLLVLVEDWCGDAFNTVPLAAAVPGLDMRVLARDENPDLMDSHLTNGSRSIPVVMVLDEQFEELGWWGPRPAELQRWVLGEGQGLAKEERYKAIRTWYARDRGRTTLEEVVGLIERGATRRVA